MSVSVERHCGFVKQSYNLEDIRIMKYRRLKSLVVLVTAAAYFAATYLGHQMKLRILTEKLLVISQRFFGIPPFRFGRRNPEAFVRQRLPAAARIAPGCATRHY